MPHRHGGELPEVRHQAGMRIGGQAPATGLLAGQLHAVVVELLLAQAPLDEGLGVDPGRGVALEEDLVAGGPVRLAPEEVVEAHAVEGRRRGEGGQVAADALRPVVGPYHHRRCVPAGVTAYPLLERGITWEPGLAAGRDGVDVGRRHGGREADLAFLGPLEELHQQETGPLFAVHLQHGVEGPDPLFGLGRVDIGQLVGDTVEDHVFHRRAGGARTGSRTAKQFVTFVSWPAPPVPVVCRGTWRPANAAGPPWRSGRGGWAFGIGACQRRGPERRTISARAALPAQEGPTWP
jgi:hypothetical protein